MASKKEIDKHLKIALQEIGKIHPWYDEQVSAWIFEHPLYPVGYAGDNPKEVLKKYPQHLREFIAERLNDNLNPLIEKETRGHGGARTGAGRPIGTIKEETKQVRLPIAIAEWLKIPGVLDNLRHLMQAYNQAESHSKFKARSMKR